MKNTVDTTEGVLVTACNAEHTAPTFMRVSYSSCKALFEERGEERGKGLSVLQEPLEEGDAVGFSARLECLLSGLRLTLRVTLFTVAQQHVQQVSHPPLPLTKSFHHHRELQDPVITDFSNHKESMTMLPREERAYMFLS